MHWEQSGRPLSTKLMSNFEPWSEVIGGILECNGFGSPCEPNPATTSGDRDTIQMITLVANMDPKTDYKFADLVTLAQQLDLFDLTPCSATDPTAPIVRRKRDPFFQPLRNDLWTENFLTGGCFATINQAKMSPSITSNPSNFIPFITSNYNNSVFVCGYIPRLPVVPVETVVFSSPRGNIAFSYKGVKDHRNHRRRNRPLFARKRMTRRFSR